MTAKVAAGQRKYLRVGPALGQTPRDGQPRSRRDAPSVGIVGTNTRGQATTTTGYAVDARIRSARGANCGSPSVRASFRTRLDAPRIRKIQRRVREICTARRQPWRGRPRARAERLAQSKGLGVPLWRLTVLLDTVRVGLHIGHSRERVVDLRPTFLNREPKNLKFCSRTGEQR